MPKERFFTAQLLQAHKQVELSQEESHHLFRVMRAREGDEVELINGKNTLAKALVKNGGLYVETVQIHPPKAKTILALAIPRFNRLEYILEKCTELGVFEFWLFPGMLSEKIDFSANQKERMEHLCIAALKQSGRLDLPQILYKPLLSDWTFDRPFLFGDTTPRAPLIITLSKPLPSLIFIGPESGFHPEELTLLRAHGTGVKLHDNILRVDTAAITAATLLATLNAEC